MTRPRRVAVVLEDGVEGDSVIAALPTEHDSEILPPGALGAQADILVVGCEGSSEEAVALVAEAVAVRPDRPVVVVAAHRPNGSIERLFAAGAADIVVLPEDPEGVAFALEKAMARRRGASTKTARVVTVLGPKGGTGKTLLASNLAVALARAGRRTTAVDLDLQFGDLALALGLDPRRTLYDLARAGSGIDAEKLDGFTVSHASGLRALLAPLRPDEAAAIENDLLGEVWATLRTTEDYVVVDTSAGFQPEVIAAVDAASDLVLVGTLDAGSLKDTKLGLETVGLMGRDPGDVVLVLNRAGSKVGLDERDVVRVLGRKPDVLVPSDREVPRSLNAGRPIVESAPRSGAAQAIAELAARLSRRDS